MNIISTYKHNWPIVRTTYKCSVRKIYKITIIDKILCGIVNNSENQEIHYDDLGLLLGFGMKDIRSYSTEIKFFKDEAEIKIFNTIIKVAIQFYLLEKSEETSLVKITTWGKHALETGLKYEFHDALISGYKHLNLILKENETPYPFFKLNLHPNIITKKKKETPYLINEDIDELTSDLKFHLLQSPQNKHFILDTVESLHESKNELFLELSLSLFSNLETLEINYENASVVEITQSLEELSENKNQREYLIRKGEYSYLLLLGNLLTSTDLIPFINDDFFNPIYLINSDRINWEEVEIINFFLLDDIASGSIWFEICTKCPLSRLIPLVPIINKHLTWLILTERASTNDILSNPLLDWDIETIINKLSETELLDYLNYILKKQKDVSALNYNLIIPSLYWKLITQKLSEININNLITSYPLDLKYISKEYHSVTKNALTNLDFWKNDQWGREWDWLYISSEYDTDFLAHNFNLFDLYLNAERLFLQIIRDKEKLIRFINSPRTSALKDKLKELEFKLSHFHNAILDIDTIPLLDNNGYVAWGEYGLPGLEANENILWDDSIASNYGIKLNSKKSLCVASCNIIDISIPLNHSNIEWDWLLITKKIDAKTIIDNFTSLHLNIPLDFLNDFYNILSAKLSLTQVIQLASINPNDLHLWNWLFLVTKNSSQNLLKDIELLNKHLVQIGNLDAISVCTEKIDLDFISKHLNLRWDWKIVTETKIDKLHAKDYFESLAKYLDWSYVVKEVYHEENFNDFETLNKLASYIKESNDFIKISAWSEITKKVPINNFWDFYSISEGSNLFYWDWDYISKSNELLKTQIMNLVKGEHTFFLSKAHLINWTLFTENSFYSGWLKKLAPDNEESWLERVNNIVMPIAEYLDWSLLSKNSHINYHNSCVFTFHQYWDWEVFSQTSRYFARKKDDKLIFDLPKIGRLNKVLEFKALTTRKDIQIDEKFVLKYAHKDLNWEYLSSSDSFPFSFNLFFDPNEKERQMLLVDKNGHAIIDKEWDWKLLSSRKNIVYTPELIIDLKDKDWDWCYFSDKSFINNYLITETQEKDWNYISISKNKDLIFDENLIKLLLVKDEGNLIDWKSISRFSSFHISKDILSYFSLEKLEKLDWVTISNSANLDSEKLKQGLLEKYKKYWSWETLLSLGKIELNQFILDHYSSFMSSQCISNYIDPRLLIQNESNKIFDLINWSIFCERDDISNFLEDFSFLEKHKKYLDWSKLSQKTSYNYSPELLLKYKYFWNWNLLKKNPSIKEDLNDFVLAHIQNDSKLYFLDKINQIHSTWAGYIFHFTNLPNAIKVLNSSSILSRNIAVDFDDAAGSVVGRRDSAHAYARFYFRPQTPTQFYNEELGQDKSNKYEKTYDRALNLGLPKCPIPVFFRFNLKDVLFDNNHEYRISNGNMQTNRALALNITEALNLFDFENVFATFPYYRNYFTGNGMDKSRFKNDIMKYIDKSQQEFLIKSKFDFSEYFDYQIIVQNEFIKNHLMSVLTSEKHKKRIVIDNPNYNVFHNDNKSIFFSKGTNSLNIKTNYLNKHRFKLTFKTSFLIESMEGAEIILKKNAIEFSDFLNISFKDVPQYTLEFTNEIKSTPWQLITSDGL